MKKCKNKTSQASQKPAKTKFSLYISFYDSVVDRTVVLQFDESGFKSLQVLKFFHFIYSFSQILESFEKIEKNVDESL